VKNKMAQDINDFIKRIQEDFLSDMQAKMGDVLGGTGIFGKTGTMDPYMILGLNRDATDEEVKSRFRELARLLHPDTSAVKGTSFLFQLVNLAYNMIVREKQHG